MIWATVSSRCCFCWLYRAFPSLAAKNIVSPIPALAIWWCPCVESSLVLLEESVCYDQWVLLAKLHKPFPCFILYSKAKFACYSRYFLISYFCIPAPETKANIQESGNSQKPKGQAQQSGKQTYGTNNRDAENQWSHGQTTSYKL